MKLKDPVVYLKSPVRDFGVWVLAKKLKLNSYPQLKVLYYSLLSSIRLGGPLKSKLDNLIMVAMLGQRVELLTRHFQDERNACEPEF